MNRFARSSALAGAAVIALVLAIAASATTTRSERSTAPTAGAAVTNYLTYVKGKRGVFFEHDKISTFLAVSVDDVGACYSFSGIY
jgi:roadblock/LC7 domain-containing protein